MPTSNVKLADAYKVVKKHLYSLHNHAVIELLDYLGYDIDGDDDDDIKCEINATIEDLNPDDVAYVYSTINNCTFEVTDNNELVVKHTQDT